MYSSLIVVTWVEEDDGSEAAQLSLVHLHVFHLRHQLRQHPGDHNTARKYTENKSREKNMVTLYFAIPSIDIQQTIIKDISTTAEIPGLHF